MKRSSVVAMLHLPSVKFGSADSKVTFAISVPGVVLPMEFVKSDGGTYKLRMSVWLMNLEADETLVD